MSLRQPLLIAALVLPLLACGTRSDAASDRAASAPTPTRAAAAFLTPTPGFEPIRFPEDEAPHDMLTEWWYYTGHLFTSDGTRYGFEYVFFQANRGAFPPIYAAHFAVTDDRRDEFSFTEKFGINAAQATDRGFSLALEDWRMSGALGRDHLVASMERYAIDLRLTSTRPPVLHNRNGFIDFPPAGSSYYYSRTRMGIAGTLTVDGAPLEVTGQAWMDHQWGNFIVTDAGGWDWVSIQLDGGRELMLFHIWSRDGQIPLSFGTLVEPDGTARHLNRDQFRFQALSEWTSPTSGATYPSGWTVELPDECWSLTLAPTVLDQELQTGGSTGVTYWEGEVTVSGTIDGRPASGLGYVELLGYAASAP